eukprot:gene7497-7707_t
MAHHHDWADQVQRQADHFCQNVLVIGAGSYGTSLVAEEIKKNHTNSKRLPGVICPESLQAGTDLISLVQSAALVLLVVPSTYIASTVKQFIHHLPPNAVLACCAKGITTDTLQTMNEVLEEAVPLEQHYQLAYLSGPSFAIEVAQGKPTGLTIAAREEDVARRVQSWLSAANLRCYRTPDVIGLEMGGALKNVFAIGCGLADGKGYGMNGRAMLITRGD